MKNTILVTGGTGYIGSWVVKGLPNICPIKMADRKLFNFGSIHQQRKKYQAMAR
jgi:UDP-glucose 4-epimerase